MVKILESSHKITLSNLKDHLFKSDMIMILRSLPWIKKKIKNLYPS